MNRLGKIAALGVASPRPLEIEIPAFKERFGLSFPLCPLACTAGPASSDIWSERGPHVARVTNLQIDSNRSRTIMLDN